MNNRLTKQPGPALNLLRQILGIKPKPLTKEEWWQWYTAYLQTPEWKHRADRCKRLAGYKCQKCGAKRGELRSDGSRVFLQAHHLTYERVGRERQSDLLCACDYCHKEEHKNS